MVIFFEAFSGVSGRIVSWSWTSAADIDGFKIFYGDTPVPIITPDKTMAYTGAKSYQFKYTGSDPYISVLAYKTTTDGEATEIQATVLPAVPSAVANLRVNK